MNLSKFKEEIYQQVKYVVNDTNITSSVFYLIWRCYRNLFHYQQLPQIQVFIYLFALYLLLFKNCNILFMLPFFLQVQDHILAALLLIMGILASNEKWKLFIFLHTIIYQLSQNQLENTVMMLSSSFYLCLMIYSSLIFKTAQQNINYFTIFFTCSFYSLLQISCSSFLSNNTVKIGCLFALALIGHEIINNRISNISKSDIETINNISQITHFLQMKKIQLQNREVRNVLLLMHSRTCQNITCQCKQNYSTAKASSLYLMQLYEKSMVRLSSKMDNCFVQSYIQFLIQSQQIIKALLLLNKLKVNNYFDSISRLRCVIKIEMYLKKVDSKNTYHKQYKHALYYDQNCLQLRFNICQIISTKIKFWSQINQKYPRLAKLQYLGNQISAQMTKTNHFYSFKIKQTQNKLFCMEGTLIYATYLSMTTNFNEYSIKLVSSIEKHFNQNIFSISHKARETYVIRVVIMNQDNCYFQRNRSVLLDNMQNIPNLIGKSASGGLIISNISQSLCQLLGKKMKQLNNSQLQELIPNAYKEFYHHCVSNLLSKIINSFGIFQHSQMLSSNFKIPIKGSNNQLLMAQINLKNQINVNNQISIISIVKLIIKNSFTCILDFSGNIKERQQGFNQLILKHSQIIKYLQKLRYQWRQNQTIEQQVFHLTHNSCIYQIKINSPFLQFFNNKQNKYKIYPPFHIEIKNTTNQTQIWRKDSSKLNQFKNKQNQDLGIISQVHSIQEKGNVCNKFISILQKFYQNSKISIYDNILKSFLILLLICFIAIFISFYSYDLKWDNTSLHKNPIAQTLRTMKISALTVKAALDYSDVIILNKFKPNQLNYTRINQYFQANNYSQFLYEQLTKSDEKLRHQIFQLLQNPSDLLSQLLMQKWSQQIQYKTYLFGSANPIFKVMQMTYLQLLQNYVIDLNLLQHSLLQKQVLFSKTYDEQIIQIQKVSKLIAAIDQSIDNSILRTLIITVILSVAIVSSIVPLNYTLRSRQIYHIHVFDLMISLKSNIVTAQLRSLKKILFHIKNHHNFQNYKEKLEVQENILMEDQLILKQTNQNIANKLLIKPKHLLSNLIQNNQKDFIILQNTLISSKQKNGELNIQNSQFDSSKLYKPKHLVIYTAILALLSFLIFVTLSNKSYLNEIKIKKDKLFSLQTQKIQNQIMLLLAKDYIRNGFTITYSIMPPWGLKPNTQIPIDADINYAAFFLKSIIQQVPNYRYNEQNNQQQIISDCSSSFTDLDASSLRKYCQYNSSYVILIGQFGSFYKTLEEQRFNCDTHFQTYLENNQTDLYFETIKQITQNSFFMQSLNNQIAKNIDQMVNILLQDILQTSKDERQGQLALFVLAISWAVCLMFVGSFIILKMKKQYRNEVYMLNFLNREMVSNNKRIQSFINDISASMVGN